MRRVGVQVWLAVKLADTGKVRGRGCEMKTNHSQSGWLRLVWVVALTLYGKVSILYLVLTLEVINCSGCLGLSMGTQTGCLCASKSAKQN